jgi:HSP20 family protein
MNKKTEKEEKQEIQKAQPVHALNPFEEMERLMESHFPRNWFRSSLWDYPSWGDLSSRLEVVRPKVDLIDRDHDIVIKAEMPGVDKDDIDISVTRNTVTIKGETSHEEEEEKGDFYRKEMTRGSFSRRLTLPADVDEEKAKAEFKDGVLELTLPKVEKAKRRKIKVG